MALTPAAVLMFRYNNPDALLTFLLDRRRVGAPCERSRTGRVRWLVLSRRLRRPRRSTPSSCRPTSCCRRSSLHVARRRARVARAARRRPRPDGRRRVRRELLVGRHRGADPGRPAAVHRRLARTARALQLLFGYDGLGRIFGQGGPGAARRRPGPGGDGGFSGNPGCCGSSTRSSATRSAGSSRSRSWASGRGWSLHVRAPADRPSPRGLPALGRLVPRDSGCLQLHVGDHPQLLRASRWRRRSACSSAPASSTSGGARSRSLAVAGSSLRAASLPRRCGRRCCSTGRRGRCPGLDVVVVMVALAAAVVIAIPEARRFPRLSSLAAAVALAALLVGPSVYAAEHDEHGLCRRRSFCLAEPPTTGGPAGAGGPGGSPARARPAAARARLTPAQALYDYLLANRGSADWIVAVQGANEAAQIELATGQPVMAMGGFSGSDPAPTLAQLQELRGLGPPPLRDRRWGRTGRGGPGGGGPGGGRGTTGEIAQWVASHGSLVESVSGVSLYDLRPPRASAPARPAVARQATMRASTQLAAPPAPAARFDRLAAYREARRKGVAWLLRHLNADGSIGDPTTGFSYYRAPWAFTVVGETEAAAAVSRLDPAQPRHRRRARSTARIASSTSGPPTATRRSSSARSWPRSTTCPLGLWPGLLRRPRPAVGPVRERPTARTARGPTRLSHGRRPGRRVRGARGRATSRRPAAIADFLGRLWDVQPELPDRFHHVWSRRRQAIDHARPTRSSRRRSCSSIARQDSSQYWFFGGICAAFLCRLYQADPRPEYLALARRYQDFAHGLHRRPVQLAGRVQGIVGRLAAVAADRRPAYEAFTFRMGDWYVERQEPDGWWHPLVEETLGDVIEITPRVRDAPRHADRRSRRATGTRGSLAPPLTRLVGPDRDSHEGWRPA